MQNVMNTIRSKDWRACIVSTVPAVKWLSKYNWRKDILPDIISGLTVAVMHIPQGMAYALLGNLPPVVGIYMAFFPVFVYFLFGTSKHVSIGEKSIYKMYKVRHNMHNIGDFTSILQNEHTTELQKYDTFVVYFCNSWALMHLSG